MLTTDQWLPVGSVVHLEGRDECVTILGYMQRDVQTGLVWDYFGLDHPMGFYKPGNDVLFDRDSIDGVVSVGYQDIDWERFVDMLKATEDEYLAAKMGAAKAAAARA